MLSAKFRHTCLSRMPSVKLNCLSQVCDFGEGQFICPECQQKAEVETDDKTGPSQCGW